MKYLTLFTVFASFVGLVYSQQEQAETCPRQGNSCNKNNKPSASLTGKLVQQFSTNGYKCSGNIEILNECEFIVKNFEFSTGKQNSKLEFFSAKKGSDIGAKINALTELNKSEVTISNIDGSYCWVNLNEDVDVIRLIEDDNTMICEAEIKKGSSSTDDSKSDSSSDTTTVTRTKTVTTTKATKTETSSDKSTKTDDDNEKETPTPSPTPSTPPSTTTPNAQTGSPTPTGNSDEKSDALISFMVPSTALYLVSLVLSLYLFN